ncbi:hypothetical protein M9Y10_015119 [Tritrichomonas musculus]|uniref:DUF3447 domain-containing protein n=1 Tax=Tritrichomonas musculus TaxID=1915356 RepID=A0ABR2L1I4_9EUKA
MLFSYGKIGEENPIDFTLKMNQSRIKCCKSIIQQASQVLSKYITSHPNSHGCSCEIKKLPTEKTSKIIQNLFSGHQIIIDNDNIEILNDISKNLKMNKLLDQLSLFQMGNFSDEIEIEDLLLSLNTKNFDQTLESLLHFNEHIISHILLGVCACKIRKPNKVKLYLDLLDKLDIKVQERFMHHLINVINHSKKNTSLIESEVHFLLYQLYDRKKIDQLQIQTLKTLPLNFSNVIKNAEIQIEESLLNKYSSEGVNPNIIAYSLRTDDIETFAQLSESFSDFDFTQKIERNPFESCEYINKGCYLIEYAAFFGSVNCFKYLLDKYTILPFNLAKYAIAGGKDDIIKICEEKNCNFDNTLTPAIIYHNQSLIEWLITDKNQEVTLSNLNECIEFANFKALQYFIRKQNKEVVDFTVAARYNLSDFIVRIASSRTNVNSKQSNNNSSLSLSLTMGSNIYENDFLSSIKNKKILLQIACLYGNEEVFNLFYSSSNNFSANSSNISSPRSSRPSSPRRGKDGVSIGQSNLQSSGSSGFVDESIFISACKGGNINIIKRILSDYKVFDSFETLFKGLFSAVSNTNDVQFVQYLYDKLSEKKKVNLEMKIKDQTLLYKAAKKGKYKVVEFILKKGANVNSINGPLGATPLYIACLNGKLETVISLIKNRIKPELNVKTSESLQTPLHAACIFGNYDIVEFLLTYPLTMDDINANLYDSQNRAPIHIACMKKSTEIVSILINYSYPSLNVRSLKDGETRSHLTDANSQTPIEIVVENGSTEIASLLLGMTPASQVTGAALSKTLADESSSLSTSSDSDSDSDRPHFKKFKSSKVNIRPSCKVTPDLIYSAVSTNNTEMLKLLVKQKNLFMNSRSKKHGTTPLSQAVLNSNPEIVKILLKQSLIDVNSKNSDGSTALHVACKEGDLVIIQILLKHEFVDPSLKDLNGNTPLHLASEYGHSEAVRMLLQHSEGEISRTNMKGQKPQDVAANDEIRNLLKANNCSSDD